MSSQIDSALTRTVSGVRRGALAQLSSLYRSELAATQTYTVALYHESLAFYGSVLRRQRRVHEERLAALGERFIDLGEKAPDSSGAWGTFVRLIEDVAAGLTPEMALAVLAEEEETLANDYVGSLELLDTLSSNLVAERLLPGQNVTVRVIRRTHERSAL